MFYWIYDLPNWVAFLLFTVVAVALSWLAVFGLRNLNPLVFGTDDHEDRNGLIELALTGTGLFYGLLLGLIAAATYTTFADTEQVVSDEATAFTALYRDVSNYPEPVRGRLQGDIKSYVTFVIDEAWPAQQRGEVPSGALSRLDSIQDRLARFEPATEGDKILHAEAFSQFNKVVELRERRVNAVTTSLPAPLWWVLVLGAVINIALVAMLAVRRLAAHLVISGLFAIFVAMMIFLIVSMDNPFRGKFSVQPEAFEALRATLLSS